MKRFACVLVTWLPVFALTGQQAHVWVRWLTVKQVTSKFSLIDIIPLCFCGVNWYNIQFTSITLKFSSRCGRTVEKHILKEWTVQSLQVLQTVLLWRGLRRSLQTGRSFKSQCQVSELTPGRHQLWKPRKLHFHLCTDNREGSPEDWTSSWHLCWICSEDAVSTLLIWSYLIMSHICMYRPQRFVAAPSQRCLCFVSLILMNIISHKHFDINPSNTPQEFSWTWWWAHLALVVRGQSSYVKEMNYELVVIMKKLNSEFILAKCSKWRWEHFYLGECFPWSCGGHANHVDSLSKASWLWNHQSLPLIQCSNIIAEPAGLWNRYRFQMS